MRSAAAFFAAIKIPPAVQGRNVLQMKVVSVLKGVRIIRALFSQISKVCERAVGRYFPLKRGLSLQYAYIDVILPHVEGNFYLFF